MNTTDVRVKPHSTDAPALEALDQTLRNLGPPRIRARLLRVSDDGEVQDGAEGHILVDEDVICTVRSNDPGFIRAVVALQGYVAEVR